ncbi:hypothetical protein ATK17_3846 [Branchiibius hedensis]|uniref:Uncharacterized protein n=1 Tax=Branchiibius hedensis TaxID=672460 RepID=A0A2Y9BNW6_9MICO|nr:hypothetical protein ATK17_3846 [Branchiibius hedensis]SSA59041.1 hypothetical protein SAMN04489750_3846 [Branchiibius hedensis]
MFDPTGWFAIDAANARVAGVVVPSLDAGLALLGRGRVASIVGRLRLGMSAVDVDVDGIHGHAITEEIARWCAQHDTWNLVRPSGPVDGRNHVFIALPPEHKQLREYIGALREKHAVAARSIDLRTAIRPLSAPHRTGPHPQALGDLREALRTLPRLAAAVPTTTNRAEAPGRAPLKPRPRRRMDLPPEWAAYLRTGERPEIGGHDHKVKPWGSSWEAIATAWLLRCGHDAASAWQEISGSHPSAMGKAKARGRSWWIQYVWNRAVRNDDAFEPVRQIDPAVAAAVAAARDVLDDLQWRHPARRRPSLLLVGHHILDRMERTNTLRVPVPERDLVLDTGVSDRATIRQALRDLDGRLGRLDTSTFSTTKCDSSSFEFEVPRLEGVREILPPGLHTPGPKEVRGLWSTLPRASHQLWRTLQRTSNPQTTGELCAAAAIVENRADEPSASQLRTTRAALTALARAGLVQCDEAGQWMCLTSPPTVAVREEAAARHAEACERIEAERAAYRAGARSDWSVARAAALKANRAREKAWWDQLERSERLERAASLSDRFRSQSIDEQERLKSAWADRRRRAGVDEAERHDHWVDHLSPATLERESADRAMWFAGLAPPLQQAYVAAWRRHRDRYGISQATQGAEMRRESTRVFGAPGAGRDQAFLESQAALPGFDRDSVIAR